MTGLMSEYPHAIAAILIGAILVLTLLREMGKVSMRFLLGAVAAIFVVFGALGFRLVPGTPVLEVILFLAVVAAALLFGVLVFMVTFRLFAGAAPFGWWREDDARLRERAAARKKSA